MEQVEKGWLEGPFPHYEDGHLLTGEGLVRVNPALRFGVHQGAAGELRKSRANETPAIRTPVNLPTLGHFATVVRLFQEKKERETGVRESGQEGGLQAVAGL